MVEWFRWERQSTIQPIFPFVEACNYRVLKHLKASYPTSILIFKGNVVTWCGDSKKFAEAGRAAIKFYKNEANFRKLQKELDLSVRKLNVVFQKIENKKLAGASGKELIVLYNSFYDAYADLFAITCMVEPMDAAGEQELKQKIPASELGILTAVSKESFVKRQDREFLAILAAKKQGKDVSKLLREHVGKYFWMKNNYSTTVVLGVKYFAEELRKAGRMENPRGKIFEMQKNAGALLEKKEALLAQLGGEEQKLVRLLDFLGWLQDYRKELTLKALHYLDLLLSEISARSNFSLEELKFVFPNEMENVLGKKLSKDAVLERMANCVVVWKAGESFFEHYDGKLAVAKEKKFFPERALKEILELDGFSAQRGKARATAFVTMTPANLHEMKPGQVLVTSMTSPDFIVGIKKASAIVTDWGGVLCHAAIVSREFGIPCVVGTGRATKAVKSGDLVEVDGNHGKVRILK